METLYFFFPFRYVSGVPILFARIIERLQYEKNIVIVDYKDGALNRLTAGCKADRLYFHDGKQIEIVSGTLIMQAYNSEYIRPELSINPDVKILFWGLHSSNLCLNRIRGKEYRCLRQREYGRLKAFLRRVDEKNGLIFMDESTRSFTEEYLSLKLSAPISPIMTGNKSVSLVNTGHFIDKNSWAYLGRVESFKTKSLIKLLLGLNKLYVEGKLDSNFTFYIIGNGQDLDYVGSVASTLNYPIKTLGFIDNRELFLTFKKYKISCVAAMGTSILDAMYNGALVIKMNFFEFESAGYPKYNFHHEYSSYCLGRQLDKDELHYLSFQELESIYIRVSTDYIELFKKQIQYLSFYYDDEKNIAVFLKNVDNVMLQFSDIASYFNRSTIRKLYHKIRYNLYK